MRFTTIEALLRKQPRIDELMRRLASSAAMVPVDISLVSGAYPWLIADAAQHRPLLVVTATTREAEELVAALRQLIAPASVAEFPSWETLPHERLSPSQDTVGRRVQILRHLAHPEDFDVPLRVVVAPIRAVVQPLVTGIGDVPEIIARADDQLERDELVSRLVAGAYTRTDLVEKRGQFAVRGGIVDVFPPTNEHPLRIEFFGDVVEEVRAFAVADQRSLELRPEGLVAPACRELLLTERVRAKAAALIPTHPSLAPMLESLAEGIPVDGMEALASVLADGMELLTDVMPAETAVIVCDSERVRSRAHDVAATSQEFLEVSWQTASIGSEAPIDLGGSAYRSWSHIRGHAISSNMPWWQLSPFIADEETAHGDVDDVSAIADVVTVPLQATSKFQGRVQEAIELMRERVRDGWLVVLVADGHGTAERYVESLREHDVPAALVDGERSPVTGSVQVGQAGFVDGFSSEELRLLFLTEADLLGTRAAGRETTKLPSRRRRTVDPMQLKVGDFVVHEHHGVGRYVEMQQRVVAGAMREYLVIEYAPSKRGQQGDRLFVPTDQLDLVTRYIGGEAPSVHRLGGSDWADTKRRARKAVREIAGELIKLYAARQASRGFAFSPDTPWQRELEDAFPYNETPDQASCIDEVKADMEKVVPMDRLVCGDVGYGKTEIAVRAAFKAVQDGKQVAILVPTTLLVQQHFETFSQRYAQFPVRLAALSRFQTDTEAKATLEGLTAGTIDVVIGTHRLFSANVRFKDLGLVIIDEEQRFGVEHKEHLKALRTNVDMLSMSATPIPRTMEMAITGIREMSTIQTPPEDRHPILTYVGPYSDGQVAAAIRREMLREGQVFFVHNRIESIERVAGRIRGLVPDARVVVAHGQMNEHQLEQIIVDFWHRKFDVLVSTTIVESGLDVPNANTLIVDRADLFGLSQLHQLRGRVGRGRERAYAYFMYQAEKPLTELAYDRLSTIAQHTELGAGMSVAMKDLEIRGAGNLLGAEQSGHIADVGFDLYVRLVTEAVSELRSDPTIGEPDEVKIELPLDAHIPTTYIEQERLRLEAYQRIAAAHTEEQVSELAEELLDRYGSLPDSVSLLLDVARLRSVARAAGLSEVMLAGSSIRLAPAELPESRQVRLTRLYPGAIYRPVTHTILVPAARTAKVGGVIVRNHELVAWVRELIRAVFA